MIPRAEIMARARALRADPNLVERDYVISWVLSALFGIDALTSAMAFKGGTAIRKVYFPTYRFSEDLDFTLLPGADGLSAADLRGELEGAVALARSAAGLDLQLVSLGQTRAVDGEEAFEGKVEYVGPMRRRAGSLARLKLDITRHEKLAWPPQVLPLIHDYSDRADCARLISAYRLEEIVAEKLRAILQRNRPRDVYDLWFLLTQRSVPFAREDVRRGFLEKCNYKQVAFTGVEDFLPPDRISSHALGWESSLGELVDPLPEFDQVVDGLRDAIEAIWR